MKGKNTDEKPQPMSNCSTVPEPASNVSGYRFHDSETLVEERPKPPTARFRVRTNTPDGVALPLPLVAYSRTFAQENRGAVSCAPAAPITARFLFHGLPSASRDQ